MNTLVNYHPSREYTALIFMNLHLNFIPRFTFYRNNNNHK